MTPPRMASAVLGALAATAAVAAAAATASSGGVAMSSNVVQQNTASTVVSSSGSGGGHSSAVVISQSSGGLTSLTAQAVATSPPGPTLVVRLSAGRLKELLAERRALLEVTAGQTGAVDVVATLHWRPEPGRRSRVVLLHRDVAVQGGTPRRLRLGASARGLARLPDAGRITLKITGRGADGATVGLGLTA